MSTDMTGWCALCRAGSHNTHNAALGGICVGCACPVTAADRPTDTDNARRRHLAEMTRQAFADGLYETAAADYAEALRRARGKNPAATIEDAAQAIHDRHCTSDDHGPHCMFWDEDYESAEALHARGLLATARTRPTREELIDALVMSPLSDTAGTDMRPFEQTADAVLALFRGGDG